jgi:hypothetical protein
MARSERKQVDTDQTDKKFEKQMRQLNRKRLRHAIEGLLVLAAILLALQFTPYRNIHRDVIRAAKGLLESLTAGPDAPVEPNPKYW